MQSNPCRLINHQREKSIRTSLVADGAKAAAEARRRAETTAVNFMVGCYIIRLYK
jgi:pyrimidine deaminase RibD-like protein